MIFITIIILRYEWHLIIYEFTSRSESNFQYFQIFHYFVLMFETTQIERIIISAVILIIGSALLLYLISWIRKYIHEHPGKEKGKGILRKVILPVTILILLIALKLNISLILTDTELLEFSHQFLNISLIFSGAWVAINAVRISRILILRNYDLQQKDNLLARKVYTQFRILERIVIFLIIFLAIAFALMTFESIKRIGISLFASAGIAGVILGLAAQKAIATILAGFQIAVTQPIRIDDVVIVEGEWGKIEEITLTFVVIKVWDQRRLVVPTTYFIEKPFQNWTRVSSDILGTVFLFTDYTLPVDELRKVFMQFLTETQLWDGKTANVQVTNSNPQNLELRFLMSAADASTLWDLRVLIRERLVEYLQKNHPDKLPKTRVEMK